MFVYTQYARVGRVVSTADDVWWSCGALEGETDWSSTHPEWNRVWPELMDVMAELCIIPCSVTSFCEIWWVWNYMYNTAQCCRMLWAQIPPKAANFLWKLIRVALCCRAHSTVTFSGWWPCLTSRPRWSVAKPRPLTQLPLSPIHSSTRYSYTWQGIVTHTAVQ